MIPVDLKLPADQLERVIDAAERGEQIAIQLNGEMVAVVIGIEEYEVLLEAMRSCVGIDD